jgi:hypothetical protein
LRNDTKENRQLKRKFFDIRWLRIWLNY